MSLREKLLCLILCTIIVSSLGITVWAETIVAANGSASHEVYAYYDDSMTTGTVYSVDISWGDMIFMFQESKGVWNPSTHEYSSAVSQWVPQTPGGDKITITNHSNAPITANLEMSYSGIAAIQAFFSQNNFSLASAENTAVANAPSSEITVSFDGSFSADKGSSSSLADLGSITITITPQ